MVPHRTAPPACDSAASPGPHGLSRAGALAWILAASLLGGCVSVHSSRPADPAGNAVLSDHPTRPTGWQRTELYVATGIWGESGGIDEGAWRDFLDTVVTPRFPDGFTLYDAYGQWRSAKDPSTAAPRRLRSKCLVILHPATPEADIAIEEIRARFKTKFGHESVLRASHPVEVRF